MFAKYLGYFLGKILPKFPQNAQSGHNVDGFAIIYCISDSAKTVKNLVADQSGNPHTRLLNIGTLRPGP